MEFTTKAFKTRSEIIEMKNLEAAKTYPIALDIGYSAVKGMSPNCVFCFPAFAREQAGQMVGTPKDTDIFYKGEDGIVYTVGEMAVEGLSSKDTDDSTNTLYGRNRYYAPSFKILARVGMALAMKTNSVGGYDGSKPIFLQTGLPPAFRRGDTPALVEVLAGNHRFSVKFGILPVENLPFFFADYKVCHYKCILLITKWIYGNFATRFQRYMMRESTKQISRASGLRQV